MKVWAEAPMQVGAGGWLQVTFAQRFWFWHMFWLQPLVQGTEVALYEQTPLLQVPELGNVLSVEASLQVAEGGVLQVIVLQGSPTHSPFEQPSGQAFSLET